MTSQTPLPHRRRAWLLGVVVPVAITAAASGLIVTWLPRLPDTLVTHWGTDGPDAYGSTASLLVPLAVYGAVSLLVCGLFAVFTGRTSMVRRLTAGIATGMAALNAGLALAAVESQLDAAGPAEVADPGGRILIACTAAVAAGGIAAMLAGADRRTPASAALPASAPRADLSDTAAPTVWQSEVTVSRSGRWLLTLLAVLLSALAVGAGVGASSWWVTVLLLVPLPLMFLFLSWRVRVDAGGLTVVSTLGRPRQHVPAGEVEHAEVIEVDPFGEFGGVGLRIAPDIHGTVGVVLRKGEAILVHRSARRRFVVTVDDAARGAALLNTHAERARAGHP